MTASSALTGIKPAAMLKSQGEERGRSENVTNQESHHRDKPLSLLSCPALPT